MLVPWWGLIPFVIMLASIAVMPLAPQTQHLWENVRFQLGLSLVLGLPVAIWMWFLLGPTVVFHTVVEYVQFIALLFALFVVAGGFFMTGDIRATPRNNTVALAIGGVLASFIGTTGAAMLLIRPLLNINQERKLRVHTVVFTILVVANNGGLLTPLGDPPLFLGFLRGVPFTWTFTMLPEWAFINGMLLLTYFALDRRAYRAEGLADLVYDDTNIEPLRFRGRRNLVWFAVIILGVALVPSLDLHAIEEGHAAWTAYVPWRELLMGGAAGASYFLGSRTVRYDDNKFTWGPIGEVAALFVGIFLTMIPALHYLGDIAPKLPLNEITLFIFTGGLSSVLDNAPTYATFFEMASKLPGETLVAGVPEIYLLSISLGAVTCGAITYIGNGPNFMVKSVAESAGVGMPSFGGYIVWTFRYLVPVLVAMVCLFIAQPLWANVLGLVVTALVVLQAVANIRGTKGAARIPAGVGVGRTD
ncbi:Na+/H+ antiporter NhaD [Raineyella antarctica]|uniref:Na+/H+ antiporter NhaD n=1 Tax=Raineyella antarctica TaxID=1577474 RepID=A0A1G6HNE3_9ACTN|nr:sodium:proton antiporter [Raineyella antarctica]SDB95648.1 Na+/H+ antiporter NhaD [Raineyella antarctica]